MNINRIIDAIRSIIKTELVNMTFLGTYEYSIQEVTQDGDVSLLTIEPTDTTLSLPSIPKVPISQLIGERVEPKAGNLCRVIFINGSPARPCVVSCDGTIKEIVFDVEKMDIGKLGALGVARLGDQVQAGPYTGVITQASTNVKSI